MPCYSPLQAFYVYDCFGRRGVEFSASAAGLFEQGADLSSFQNVKGESYFQLPCGKCMGCRLERSRQWAVRIVHEASMYDDNCFVTLTYDPEFLPKSGSLDKSHFQLFMKKLRRKYVSKMPELLSEEEAQAWVLKNGIRYYHCGEYGECLDRPHYHACLFNFDFPDKVLWKVVNGENLYISPILSELWGMGHCTLGNVTFESAAYVARYCTKKVNGILADDHYKGRLPEYATMSRRPGIGRGWFDKFQTDVFPRDEVIVNGVRTMPPRYYAECFNVDWPEEMEEIKSRRLSRAEDHADDNTCRRLKDREKCKKAQFKRLIRPMEK